MVTIIKQKTETVKINGQNHFTLEKTISMI